MSLDETFCKKSIKSGETLLLISGSFEAKVWKRFPNIEYGDYFYMNETYYDAVCFVPNTDIYFLGFGFTNHYEQQTFKIMFRY